MRSQIPPQIDKTQVWSPKVSQDVYLRIAGLPKWPSRVPNQVIKMTAEGINKSCFAADT